MAFDGTTIHALCVELNDTLTGGRLSKIAQPASDELLLTIKAAGGTHRLLMSANASLPLLYLTEENRQSPLTAPNFCMLLRKHLTNGRITAIEHMGFERVVRFSVEHLDELGDISAKYLYVELMGKHSNIIFTDTDNVIIDAIKRVGGNMSSVRLVLPSQPYFIPAQEGRLDPMSVTRDEFLLRLRNAGVPVAKALTGSFTGFGRAVANEIAYRAGLDADRPLDAGDTATEAGCDKEAAITRLYDSFSALMDELASGHFSPELRISADGRPLEYAVFTLTHYEDSAVRHYDSVSALLYDFYSEKNRSENRRAKTLDLKKNVQILLERNIKKLAIQKKQLADTDKMETYRVRGELLHTYGYNAKAGARELTVENYYTNEPLTIPLDPTLSALENAKKYFDKYEKLKRTKTSVTEQITETEVAVAQLSSILVALDMADTEADLLMIRQELSDYGYMRKRSGKKTASAGKSKPLCYETADGFRIYVGKNNYQNDELTFKLATGNDWWFHAKQIPGSHVILRTEGREVPDHVFEIAAAVAAYYSSGRESEKLEIDYVPKKEIKKPAKAVAGFVVYYTNYSMTVHPTLAEVTEVK